MKKYKYTIVGRTPGNIRYTTYNGTLETGRDDHDAKSIVKLVFGNEFGTPHDEYEEALTDATISEFGVDTITTCIDTGEFTFDVEIVEITDEEKKTPPFPNSYGKFIGNHGPLLDWCRNGVLISDPHKNSPEAVEEDDINEFLVDALEQGLRNHYSNDASEAVDYHAETLRSGCKGWESMSRDQLLEEMWNFHGESYVNKPGPPTWEGFLRQFE